MENKHGKTVSEVKKEHENEVSNKIKELKSGLEFGMLRYAGCNSANISGKQGQVSESTEKTLSQDDNIAERDFLRYTILHHFTHTDIHGLYNYE